jgi:sarcosine oxidase subunit gamma
VISGPTLCGQIEPEVRLHGIVPIDLSPGLVAVRVEGPAVRDVLTKGCGLDLDSNNFPVGLCTQTRFAQLRVIVECVDSMPSFELYVGRSYTSYLLAWLADSAAEFQ